MPKKRIRGRVIRILDNRTVIINLGRRDHITGNSVFRILGEPEAVVDPFTEEELGRVTVVKSKVKALEVFEGFTIATTKWTTSYSTLGTINLGNVFAGTLETRVFDEGELLVNPEDMQPWRAQSEVAVQVGDYVEVEVSIPEADDDSPQGDLGEEEETQAEDKPAEHTM